MPIVIVPTSHAYWGLGDADKCVEAYQRGLKQDPQNEGLLQALRNAENRIAADSESTVSRESQSDDSMPGGAAGLPDIAGLMNNPQMRAMAQQLASNGGLASLMQNPGVQNMVRSLLKLPDHSFSKQHLDEPDAEWQYAFDAGIDERSHPQGPVSSAFGALLTLFLMIVSEQVSLELTLGLAGLERLGFRTTVIRSTKNISIK